MQMETAALKANSDTKNKVFVRKVTAVYTPATLEAVTEDDVGAERDAVATGEPTLEPLASSYLMALCESGATSGRGALPCQRAHCLPPSGTAVSNRVFVENHGLV
jgi:hypothetical protein